MRQEQLEKFRVWFDGYVAEFYSDDEYMNASIRLKDQHSRRVCDEMRSLTNHLNLTDNQKRIAEVIALLHDIGRFRQFQKYRTYNDPASVDHGQLALQVLNETNILDGIDNQEKFWIEKAIELHGWKLLPNDLDDQTSLYCRLIRDADKIDVFHVVIGLYEQYKNDPESFKYELELPNKPYCSSEIVQDVLSGRQIDYRRLKTWNDMKLLHISWVYDINFAASLRIIKKRKFLETVFDFLPQNSDIEKLRKTIFEYVDNKIKN